MLVTVYGLIVFVTIHPLQAYMTFMLYTTLGGRGPHGLDVKARISAWMHIETLRPGLSKDEIATVLKAYLPIDYGHKYLRRELWARWVLFAASELAILVVNQRTRPAIRVLTLTILCYVCASIAALIGTYLAAESDYVGRIGQIESSLATGVVDEKK